MVYLPQKKIEELILKLRDLSLYQPHCYPAYVRWLLCPSLGSMKNFFPDASVGRDVLHLGRLSVETTVVVLIVVVRSVTGVFSTVDPAECRSCRVWN